MRKEIKTVLFDFGGVLAEEGFREGIKAIARKAMLNEDIFFVIAHHLVFNSGYATGSIDEKRYWSMLKKISSINIPDRVMREEVLSRFILRDEMIGLVKEIKSNGFRVAILSDQTNWLDELNSRTPFFHHFDGVYNSFHLKKSKKEADTFLHISALLENLPEEILFIDDDPENIERAKSKGLEALLFDDKALFLKDFNSNLFC